MHRLPAACYPEGVPFNWREFELHQQALRDKWL